MVTEGGTSSPALLDFRSTGVSAATAWSVITVQLPESFGLMAAPPQVSATRVAKGVGVSDSAIEREERLKEAVTVALWAEFNGPVLAAKLA
jgi:hypothetical protein